MPLTIPEYITIKTAAGATAAFLSPEADGLKDAVIDRELNGKSKQYMSELARGNIRLTYDMAVKIAEALNTTPDDLFLPEQSNLIRRPTGTDGS